MNSTKDKTDSPNSNNSSREQEQQDRAHIDDEDETLARKLEKRHHSNPDLTDDVKDAVASNIGAHDFYSTGRPRAEWHDEVFPWTDKVIANGMSKNMAYKKAFHRFDLGGKKYGISGPSSVKRMYLDYNRDYWTEEFYSMLLLKRWCDAINALRQLSPQAQVPLLKEWF